MTRRASPFADPQARNAAGALGMRLFLLSLGMLFAAAVIGYAALRLSGAPAGDAGLPPLPRALWVSTLLLLAGSAAVHGALGAARCGRERRLRASMAATLLLGAAFLLVQAACWIAWAEPMREALRGTAATYRLTGFYVLTGLHGLHVLGGLVPLAVVTRRAWSGRYSPEAHAGVQYIAAYWHFLDGTWIVLFATLLLATA
jgi:cytochrome c oxidase subunit 3